MWHKADTSVPADDGTYLVQTRTGLDTRCYKNGDWLENYAPVVAWDDDGRVHAYSSTEAVPRAKMMAKYLPRMTIIAKSPDFEYIVNPNPPLNTVQIDRVELKSIDVINAFLALQQQAIEQASKEKNKRIRDTAISKIHSLTTF